MGDAVSIAEPRRFAEGNVFCADTDLLVYPVDALKPNEFQRSGLIFQVGHQSFSSPCSEEFFARYPSFHLNNGKAFGNFADAIKARAVFIAKWVVLEQIAKGEYAEFLVQQCRPLGADALQEFDRCIEKRTCAHERGQYSNFRIMAHKALRQNIPYFYGPTGYETAPGGILSVVAMKVDCKIYKGIAYVQLGELPPAQQEILLKTIDPDQFIKIMIDGEIVSRCLQYKDYTSWYERVYEVQAAPPVSVRENRVSTPSAIEINPNLALE